MKKKLVLVLGAAMLLAACNDDANKTEVVTPAIVEQNSEAAMQGEHTSQNSLDYAGVYKGQLPCADCSGINVELTLEYDGSYDYKQTYLDVKGKDETSDQQGRFTWNKAGQVITLEGTTGGPFNEVRYFVGENVLLPADAEGKVMESDLPFDYSLHKVLPE